MTEHFTREEAVALAMDAMKSNPNHEEAGMCITMRSYEWHNLLNAAVTAKLKEWEAQGAVAWCELNLSRTGIAYFDGKPVIMTGPVGNDCHPTPLFTHALPAQPAEPVNAELVEAFKAARETLQRANDQQGYSPICDTIWHTPYETLFDFMDAALSRAQAAPAVGVPFERTAWLIECKSLSCWVAHLKREGGMTNDANKAIQFPSKESADAVLNSLFDYSPRKGSVFGLARSCYSVTEHIFMDGPRP